VKAEVKSGPGMAKGCAEREGTLRKERPWTKPHEDTGDDGTKTFTGQPCKSKTNEPQQKGKQVESVHLIRKKRDRRAKGLDYARQGRGDLGGPHTL